MQEGHGFDAGIVTAFKQIDLNSDNEISLDELEAAEEKERLAKEQADATPVPIDVAEPLDPALANQLANFDPSDPMWSALGFGGDGSWGSPGFLTGTAEVAGGSSDFP